MSVHEVAIGADAWVVLTEALAAVPLPSPFRAVDGPALTPDQAAAATAALRSSELLPGTSGDLAADLHPSLQASLLLHLRPEATIDAWHGLGDDLTATRAVLRGELASSVSRTQRQTPEGLEIGPVTLRTMLTEDLARSIVDGFGVAGDEPRDQPTANQPSLILDPATALATVRALQEGDAPLAAAVFGAPVPEPLATGALRPDAFARVDVSGSNGRVVLLALSAGGRWWNASSGAGEIELRPVDRRAFVADLAALLSSALLAGTPA